jgi:translation initiation factor IF-2
VEVRKRRVLTKPVCQLKLKPAPENRKPPEVVNPRRVKEPVSIIDAEQLALRREEARKQAELMARQAEEIKQKRERKKAESAEIVKKNDEPGINLLRLKHRYQQSNPSRQFLPQSNKETV